MPVFTDAGRQSVSANFTAAAQQSPSLRLDKNERYTVSVFIPGATTGTVELQRLLNGTDWRAVEAGYTASTEKDGIAAENMEIRLACTAFTGAGPIAGRLGK